MENENIFLNGLNKKKLNRVLFYTFIVMFVLVMVFPFFYTLFISFMTESDVESFPVRIFPSKIIFDNYKHAFTAQPIPHYIKNSFIIAFTTVFFNIAIAFMSAFALVRTNIKFKKAFMIFILAVTLLPSITIIQPIYELFSKLGLLNTYHGLSILSAVLGLPMSTWFITALIKQIPLGFEESAKIEGANLFQIFRYIYFPLLMPGIFSLFILKFIGSWNEFLLPQVLNIAKSHRTIAVGITMYQTDTEIPYGVVSAASTITILPIIFVVFMFQKHIINNVLKGGIKG